MDGIVVSAEQRSAMERSWALVKVEWDALRAAGRAANGYTPAQRARLVALAEAHNARIKAIMTPDQRARLESNLREIKRQRGEAAPSRTQLGVPEGEK